MNGLVKYEAARLALAECKAVDEVKGWVDKAAAMQAYGRMAKDKTLEVSAAEIRIRAERRLGEMIRIQKDTVGLNTGGRPSTETPADEEEVSPTLAEVGIGHKLSSRAQKLAAVPEEEFEAEVEDWKDRVKQEGQRVTSRLESAGARALKKEPKPPSPPATGWDARIAELEAQVKARDEEIASLKSQLSILADSLRDAQEDNESLDRIIRADNSLRSLMDEVGRFKEQARVNKARVDGLMVETNDLKRVAKSWMGKFQRLERATKKAGAMPEVEPDPVPDPEFRHEQETDPFLEEAG